MAIVNKQRLFEAQKTSVKHIKIVFPDSFLEFKKLLKFHPYLREKRDFERGYLRVEKYYTLMNLLKETPSIATRKLATYCNFPRTTVSYWTSKRTLPSLMRKLIDNEKLRRKHLDRIPKEAITHRIDQATVYQELKSFRHQSNRCYKSITKVLEKLHSQSNQLFVYLEFRHWNIHEEEWLVKLMRFIQRHLGDIEHELNKMLSSEPKCKFQIAIVKDRLFIRKCGTNSNLHLDLLDKELFYFEKSKRDQMVHELKAHTGGLGIVRLSQLIGQLTNQETRTTPPDGIYPDLKPDKRYLTGETLRLYLDITGCSIEDIAPDITQIGKQKQILEPHILSDESFLILMSQLFAIIGSDGHIQNNTFRCQYTEYDPTRRFRVTEITGKLGNVCLRDRSLINGKVIGFYLPSVIGRLLERLGMPVGDKVLQGIRIPPFIANGLIKVKIAYLQEVIPEEGCIIVTKNSDRAYILLGRRIVLYEYQKARKYDFANKLSSDLVEFIRKFGRKQKRNFGRADFYETYIFLTPKKLRTLKNSDDHYIQHIACQLECIIKSNLPICLKDEQALCKSIGIHTKERWTEVTLSKKTGRVSVAWELRTRSQKDTARWGILAPPNDERKRSKLLNWMSRHPDTIKEASKQCSITEFGPGYHEIS